MKSPSCSHKNGLILLGLLAILFHYPITSSPTGDDSFYYVTIVEAIISEGQIFWAINILSLYGLFPGTTPLGGPILAATIVELTNISLHEYQLLHGILFSLISIFSFFILSGEFTQNYLSRWFSSLCFSLAPRFLIMSQWSFSLRYMFIALLPIFIWFLLRTANEKYGRYPLRLIVLSFIFTLLLPSFHRMALLFPGIFLAFFLSIISNFWQESATNRERAGRQVLGILIFFMLYFFYLQYLDYTPYSSSDELFEIYFFSSSSIFSSLLNITMYYLLAAGPISFLLVLGLIFWFQQGRIPISYQFGLSYLALSMFIIADHIYISYLITFGILLFTGPGIDFFVDNLQDYSKRISLLITILILLVTSFSYVDLNYQINAHSRDHLNYSYNVRDSSLSVSYWMGDNVAPSVFECNDVKRLRRIAAYNNMISSGDALELSSGLIDVSQMETNRISVKEMYGNASDHLWVWNNSDIHSEIAEKRSLSIVNLAMPSASGKSSTEDVSINYYYKNMPNFSYRLYSNSELALYWSSGY